MKYLPSFLLGAIITGIATFVVINAFLPTIASTPAAQTLVAEHDREMAIRDFERLDYEREPEDYFFQWQVVQQFDNAEGLFSEIDEDEGLIFLHDNDSNDATGLHEVGHWYDYTQGMISLTPEFRQAIDEYLAMENVEWPELQDQIRSDYLLPEEIFADLYRIMLVSPDRIPDVFRVFFHDTFYARVNPDWRSE